MSTLKVNTVQDVAAAHSLDMTKYPSVQSYRITSSADTALGTCASGGTRVGSSFTATIPTSGTIKVRIEQAQVNWTESAGMSFGIAIEINGTTYWAITADYNGNTYSPKLVSVSNTNASWTGGMLTYNSVSTLPAEIVHDITAIGCATGSQTCYIRCGHTAGSTFTDAATVKGTTKTFVATVEIFGTSV